ncbi:hypothetical protein C6P45_001097 [Maudiozyma exigua]|uniref:Peptidase S59 domain-containing protein n=1 Tax=Maudiozyma exigua TaxID=34358 RepID=A0A9P6W234_MAUEX|nr:hypothetical protein C6P45_001097 [Kazachstania exigua]
MFGGNRTTFGNNSTNQPFSAGASPFGAQQSGAGSFGMNQQNNNTNTTGQRFGGFSMNSSANNATTAGTTGFGMNSAASNTNNTGGLFGQASNANSTGAGMFGANNSTMNGMNNTNNPLLGNSMNQTAGVGSGNGTGIKPFTAYQEKDAVTNAMNVFQSITCMPEYKNFSFEELRMQDYQVGRKFANSQVPVTNQTGMNTFGQTNGMNNTTVGATGGLFGNNTGATNNTTNTGGLFGQKPATGFGANTSTGMFGNNTNNSTTMNSPFGMKTQGTTGMFGQQNNVATGGFGQTNNNSRGMFGMNSNSSAGSNGVFGQNSNTFGNNNADAAGLFGQNNNQPQQNGLFGQKPTSTGLFGQNTNTFGNNNNVNTNTGGLFGQNTNTFGQSNNTAGGFGQTNNNNSMFGNNNNNSNTSAGFGTQQNNMNGFNQNQSAGGLFGNKSAGGLFGQNNTQQQGNVGGGMFGQNNTQQQGNVGGGLFGQNNQQNQGTNNGLFGAKPANTMGGGLFGNNTNQQKPATGGLFGAKPAGTGFGNTSLNSTGTSTGLFGNNNAANTTGQSTFGGNNTGNLFGAKPAVPVGGNSGGLFGNANNTNGVGLFNSKPATATPNGGLFGKNNTNTLNSNSTIGTGLFGHNQNQQSSLFGAKGAMGGPALQPQPQNASLLVNNPFGSNQLFNKIAIDEAGLGSARTINISKVNADVKKNNTFTGAYKLIPKPLFSTKQHIHDEENCKTSKILPGNETRCIQNNRPLVSPEYGELPRTITTSDVESATDAIRVFNSFFSDLNFNPDKKHFKSFLEEKKNKITDGRKVPNMRNVKKKDVGNSTLKESSEQFVPSVNKLNQYPVDKEKKPDVKETVLAPDVKPSPPGLQNSDFSFVDEHYYVSPSIDTLSSMSILDLRKVEHLIVGNTLYGKVEFLKPVDLSAIPVTLLCAKYVTFSKGACKVVPYSGNSMSEGSGINVPAKITIFHCYPTDRETRKPIKDPEHSVVKRHIERLRRVPHTKFEKYDPVTGNYVFNVQTPMLK